MRRLFSHLDLALSCTSHHVRRPTCRSAAWLPCRTTHCPAYQLLAGRYGRVPFRPPKQEELWLPAHAQPPQRHVSAIPSGPECTTGDETGLMAGISREWTSTAKTRSTSSRTKRSRCTDWTSPSKSCVADCLSTASAQDANGRTYSVTRASRRCGTHWASSSIRATIRC